MKTRILSIEEIQQRAGWLVPELIQVGYEQAECNEERAVDLDDAVRILTEDLGLGGDLMDVVPESISLLGTILKVKANKNWNSEFPNSIATGF